MRPNYNLTPPPPPQDNHVCDHDDCQCRQLERTGNTPMNLEQAEDALGALLSLPVGNKKEAWRPVKQLLNSTHGIRVRRRSPVRVLAPSLHHQVLLSKWSPEPKARRVRTPYRKHIPALHSHHVPGLLLRDLVVEPAKEVLEAHPHDAQGIQGQLVGASACQCQ
jgi:hypothetical protein